MFSVVVPVWNARRTLPRTVASVLAQSFGDFELILVDDGSTDGGLDALPAPRDARLVVLRQENAGEGAARNAGVAAARHDWVAFLDADDVWLPGHLAELDELRRRFPQAGLIGTAYVHSDRRGGLTMPDPDEEAKLALIPYFERFAGPVQPLCASTAAVRRDVLREVGGFGPFRLGADNELFARIALRHPVAASTRRTAVYVHGTGGLSDRLRGLRRAGPIRTAEDLSPGVATVLRHCATARPEDLPPGVDAYVNRKVGWRLRESAAAGDVRTIRALRPLYRGRPPLADRALLALGALPPPAVRAGHRVGHALRRAASR